MLDIRRWVRSPHDRLWWWALLGPSLLILSLLALGLRAGGPMASLPIVVAIALPVCSRYGLKGLVVSIALLVIEMAVDCRALHPSERIWHMGIGAAIGLALLLVVLGREEVQAVYESLAEAAKAAREVQSLRLNLARAKDRLEQLQRQMEQALAWEKLAQDRASQIQQMEEREGQLRAEVRGLYEQLEEARREVALLSHLKESESRLQRELERLNGDLQTATNRLKVITELEGRLEMAQRHLREGEAERVHEAESLRGTIHDLRAEVAARQEESERLRGQLRDQCSTAEAQVTRAVDRYKQLRGQFQEKGEVLHQARVSVWQVETRLEGLLRDQAEQAVNELLIQEGLVAEVSELQKECDSKDHEIGQLEELVSELLTELKRRAVPGLSGFRVPQR